MLGKRKVSGNKIKRCGRRMKYLEKRVFKKIKRMKKKLDKEREKFLAGELQKIYKKSSSLEEAKKEIEKSKLFKEWFIYQLLPDEYYE
jgi:hypothetical protein